TGVGGTAETSVSSTVDRRVTWLRFCFPSPSHPVYFATPGGNAMSASQPISTLEYNKGLTLRWFDEVWNQSRRDTIFELFDEDCVLYEGHTPIRGPQEFADFHDRIRAQFDDIYIQPGATLAENDMVCLRWTVSGTHKTTGKKAEVTGISIVRIKNGRFVEAWQNWDAASLGSQLSPTPPAPMF